MSGDARVKSLIDRILRLKEEQDALAADIREVYAEAKGEGYNKTAMGEVVAYLRKVEKNGKPALDEKQADFDLYLGAYERASGTALATHTHAPDRQKPVDREVRRRERFSEGMDDAKALSAEAAALGLIALPVINRTTQDMLGLVPNALREASAALGAPRWKTMTSVVYRAAQSGILTGVLLAVARVTGETAPLLFTALNNQFFSTDLGAPMANLPVVIFQFATSPYDDWQKLAWGGALLITVTILILNIVARWVAGAKSNL